MLRVGQGWHLLVVLDGRTLPGTPSDLPGKRQKGCLKSSLNNKSCLTKVWPASFFSEEITKGNGLQLLEEFKLGELLGEGGKIRGHRVQKHRNGWSKENGIWLVKGFKRKCLLSAMVYLEGSADLRLLQVDLLLQSTPHPDYLPTPHLWGSFLFSVSTMWSLQLLQETPFLLRNK